MIRRGIPDLRIANARAGPYFSTMQRWLGCALLLCSAAAVSGAQARPQRADVRQRDSLQAAQRAGSGRGAAATATTATTATTAAAVTATGTFMATRIDREPLPLKDQVVDQDGTEYLIEFDRLVLALRADATFRASLRFRRTLFSRDPRGRSRPTPLQSMTVTGTYVIADDTIRFTPDPSDETKGLRMLAGRVRSARELEVPFHYRNGTQARDRVLILTRRDDIF